MPREVILDLQAPEVTREMYAPDGAAALAFAEAMTRGSRHVSAEIVAALLEHFDEGEVVEIAMVVGLFLYFNAFNNALGIPPTAPSPYVRG